MEWALLPVEGRYDVDIAETVRQGGKAAGA